jgi:hypothetical protein
MGCDIHSYAEKQNGRRWVGLKIAAFESRDYGLFGWLADVRNYSGLAPLAAGRGLPADASATTAKHYRDWNRDAHNASWVSVSDLAGVDYEQIIEDRRCIKQLGPNMWTGGGTCEPGEGKKETLREFLGPEYFTVLKRLQDAGAERVLFWFDN